MGTRGLTAVIYKGEVKVAQYGQWDHYPSGSGLTILEFLRKYKADKFKRRLDCTRFFKPDDEKKLDKFLKSIGSKDGWMNMEQAEKYKQAFPYLTRDNGSKILEMIYKSEGEVVLHESMDFVNDSLFCEWAYVIDYDKNTFEVYEGFNKRKLGKKQRFYSETVNEGGYYPVRCIKTYSLSDLPTKRKFLKELEPKV